jgi:hypothetical protein
MNNPAASCGVHDLEEIQTSKTPEKTKATKQQSTWLKPDSLPVTASGETIFTFFRKNNEYVKSNSRLALLDRNARRESVSG